MGGSGYGMPSARGSEWKGQDVAESTRKFKENLAKIDFRNCRDCNEKVKGEYDNWICKHFNGVGMEEAIRRGQKVEGCTYGSN